MARFFALLDGSDGGYGVAFPDAPGCTAMGKTVDEALRNASLALADWVDGGDVPETRSIEELRKDSEVAEQLSDGAAFVVVPLIVEQGRPVKANISLDAGLLMSIDESAEKAGLTRSAFLASAAREKINPNLPKTVVSRAKAERLSDMAGGKLGKSRASLAAQGKV